MMNGSTNSVASVTPGSPATKRKPVPTPRSTLRKPSAEEQARKKKILNGGSSNGCIDSQGETSGESASPSDASDLKNLKKSGIDGEDGNDILAALEKIPGVGSLRSLNSVGSSQPSLTLDPRVVRREESSHSISSGLSLGLTSERKRSLGERSRTSPRILLLNGKSNGFKDDKTSDETSLSSPTTSPGKIARGTEKRRSLKSVTIQESNDDDNLNTSAEKSMIQERPLPDIPLTKTNSPPSCEEDEIEVVNKEEIYTALLTPTSEQEDHYQELNPTVTPIIVQQSKTSNKTDIDMNSLSSAKASNYLTMTGTIKRGKLPEKSVDLQLSVTPDHLTKLEKRVHDKYHDRCFCGIRRGPHVFFISLLSIPFMLVYSAFQAFFLGSMTWYNIFLHYNEERSCCHKLLSPFVLLLYPFWIVPVTIGLCLFGGIRCISWYWDSWIAEICNPDSGFMAWMCEKINLPDCAPYQVVLLSAEESPQCV